MNLGAIVGGISFGIWSERIGRKRAIIIASLLALPVIPLWAFAATPLLLAIGAFLIQVAVQGAECDPNSVSRLWLRATLASIQPKYAAQRLPRVIGDSVKLVPFPR